MAQKSGSNRVPMAAGQIPPENKVFRDFKGINTQAARQAIKEDEFSWLEGVMPVGFANMRALPQISAVLATVSGGRVIYYRKTYNIAGTNYLFLACTDGSCWQMLAGSPYTLTEIAPAGTFSGSNTQVAQWKNERLLIIDTNANGYRDWNGAALTTLSGTTGAPAGGTCIATYANRVWIVQVAGSGRTIAYSAANSYTDFTGTGGTTTINDETLLSSIQQLIPANNFLYFFGVSSINVIADVQVVGGNTQFSNTNIVANSGSDIPQSILSFYRSIWYMNESGIFSLYGATPRKASDALDAIFDNIDFGELITSGTVTLNNELCVCFCFTYNDPTLGPRQLMAIYYDKKWFLASQSTDVEGIATQHGGNDILWGSEGSNVYQLFSDPDADITQKIQTRLWDMDDFISIKETLNLGIEVITPAIEGGIEPTVDTERFSVTPNVDFSGGFAFTWYGQGTQVTPYYMRLDGIDGNYASTPNAAPLQIVGDITLGAYAAAVQWASGASDVLVSKWNGGGLNNRGYLLEITADGRIGVITTPDGVTLQETVSTAIIPVANGVGAWLMATLDVNDGGGNRVYNFYYSTQSANTAIGSVTWTQLGTTVTVAGATTIFNSNADLIVGGQTGGTANMFTGDIYAGFVYSGIMGSLVASFVANNTTPGSTTWASTLTGETWTLHGVAAISPTVIFNPTAVFPWTNSMGAPFTWLVSGYLWLQGNVEVQGHYLGVTINSSTPGNIYEGIQLQFRRLPAGWGT